MSIYLNKDSKIIVQGITGGMGSKHTNLMLQADANIVGGVNARKAGTTVELNGKELPVFGTVKEAIAETGANATVMANGLDVILNDEQVKSVFVNVFGGITACDEVANGIKGALEILGDNATKPLVVRLDGNNVEQGRAILAELNHPLVTVVDTMDGAADKAAELANA